MINRENYKAVTAYLDHVADVLQRDALTVRNDRILLSHLLRWADEAPFTKAPDIRPVFPKYVSTLGKASEGARRTCLQARVFFTWLYDRDRKQYAALNPAWVETIQPQRMPQEPRKEHQAVTLETVRALMKLETDDIALRRDKAAAAFLFLSGMRGTAFATLPIKCVDIAARQVLQYPTMGVVTKNRKAGKTSLLEIPDLLEVVAEWDRFVRSKLPDSALWYPIIKVTLGEKEIIDAPPGKGRGVQLEHRFKKLFDRAGLAYLSPHKFRHGYAVYGMERAKDIGDLKAISQNLMHSTIGITDSIYAILSDDQIQSRIANLGSHSGDKTDDVAEIVARVLKAMGKT